MTDDDARYPVGRYEYTGPGGDAQRKPWIDAIAETPARLREAVRGLSNDQLETPYRDGGWTVRQVAHHLPDSHLNAYVRFKLALTEEQPTVKPYEEAAWAELADGRSAPVEISLALMDALHERWVLLLRSMKGSAWDRTYLHPEHGTISTLDKVLGLYEWHGRHHVAHITALRKRKGW
jgi:hypothetical protein